MLSEWEHLYFLNGALWSAELVVVETDYVTSTRKELGSTLRQDDPLF
jgi:hypothetical protein